MQKDSRDSWKEIREWILYPLLVIAIACIPAAIMIALCKLVEAGYIP